MVYGTGVIDELLGWHLRKLLSLRYRVEVSGLEAVLERGRRGILILPNHPALIEPFLLALILLDDLRPLFLGDRGQVDRPLIRAMAKRYGVKIVDDVKLEGARARAQVRAVLDDCANLLRKGQNIALYPSGHLYRKRTEDLRGNSAAHALVQSVPEARVVLVRTTGLWGSAFSWAEGRPPSVGGAIKRGAIGLLTSGIFFAPRRRVRLHFQEPIDLPRTGSRQQFNAYLESYYNQEAPPALSVPHSVWNRGGAREVPDPGTDTAMLDASKVPTATRALVIAHLEELSGVSPLRDDLRLAYDLGLDSLVRSELLVWIEREMGVTLASSTSFDTVAHVLLAACGEAAKTEARTARPAPGAWFVPTDPTRLLVPTQAETVTEAFIDVAARGLSRPLLMDPTSGLRTVGDLLTGIFALRPLFTGLPGTNLGLMLPASVAAVLTYLTTLFADKIPVMVNWTLGPRHLRQALDGVGVERVVTSRALVTRLEERGTDLSSIRERFVFLEDIAGGITRGQKAKAFALARTSYRSLRHVRPREHAAVLFTSGSEAVPKAVPLTHANIMQNLRDMLSVVTIRRDDCLLGMLPPFHAFGLTVCIGAALATGLRVTYYPDPTDSGMLARIIGAHRVTALVATPTFVGGILGAGTREQLQSIRLAITGAESCPERVSQALATRCPSALVLEGYGITECSPVVSLNDERAPRPGTVGKILPSFRYAIVGVETGAEVARGQTGLLLLRGPCVFGGYLAPPAQEGTPASPFVDHDGKLWYRTGDLVSEDEEGVLTFRGRLKRFVKIGGEMVSLPAVEAALEQSAPGEEGSGAAHAVIADTRGERPELVLFTRTDIDRARANQVLREAGLSGLHSVRQVTRLESLPLLGSGKTDYRALERRLAGLS